MGQNFLKQGSGKAPSYAPAPQGQFLHRGSGGAGAVFYPLNCIAGYDTGLLALNVDTLYAIPFIIESPATMDTIGFNITTPSVLGVMRVGIYSNVSDSLLYPNALVKDFGVYDTTASNFNPVTAGSFVLQPGLYWLVMLPGTSAPTVAALPTYESMQILGSSASLGIQDLLTKAFSYAALPNPFPASAAYSNARPPIPWANFSA